MQHMIDAPSFVLHERANSHFYRGHGLLSLKTFPRGNARYTIGNAKFLVEAPHYLILNHGQEYTVEIESDVESFCLFFEVDMASAVYYSVVRDHASILAEPFLTDQYQPHFVQRTYPDDALLSGLLERVRAYHRRWERGMLEEQLQLVLARMIINQQTDLLAMDNMLRSAKVATRLELYARLHLARDYIEAMYSEPLQLNDLALVAAMSPGHMLRTFKELFGQTPHQYLINVRLNHAKRLLLTTDTPVTEIGVSVGFESLGSFSWLFRQRFGLSPRAYRTNLDDF